MYRILTALIGVNIAFASICLVPSVQAQDISMPLPGIGIQWAMPIHAPQPCQGSDCVIPAMGRETAPGNSLPSTPAMAIPPACGGADHDLALHEGIRMEIAPPLLTHTDNIVVRE